jgi:glycosyltransferase involved in cell wall biosynthesis
MNGECPHILYVIDVLYGSTAGAEGVLSKLVRRLPGEHYRCSIATFASRPHRVDTGSFACPVYKLPVGRLYGRNAMKAAWGLSRLIRSERVSIVHTFFEAADLLGGVVAKLSGCPVLVSSRRDMGFQRSRAQRLAYRLAAPLYDQVHAVSEEVRWWHISQDGLDPRKVVTIRNGVDLGEIDSAGPCPRAALGIPDGVPVIACVGNIRPVKGTDDLVRTAALVCRELPQARFLVIGRSLDHGYFQRVKDLAQELGVGENVVFAGTRLDVAATLKACNCFYLPSLSEGLSNALLEAMACRLPCVATRVGGNPEVVADGRSGYLVPARNEQQAADRILELLGDQPRAAAMGLAARRIVEERFDFRSTVHALVAQYRALLNGPSFDRRTLNGKTDRVSADPEASVD